MRKIVVFLICSFFLSTSLKTYAQTDEGLVPDSIEYQALVELYNSTNGANWTTKTNWLNGTTIEDISNWLGITLDASGKDISEVNLYNNNLVGHIPSSLGSLESLVELSLALNNLSGPIPSSFGGLTNLTQLKLNNNSLSENIPTELGQLNNLEFLYLSNNLLSGVIPTELGLLNNLQVLSLNGNNLNGTIPVGLGQLNNLEYLLLNDNNLSGGIPPELGQLLSLIYLNISNNQLNGSIPFTLGNLSNLDRLELFNNSLNGVIPEEIGQLTNLQILKLYSNQLSGEIPLELKNLRYLTFLDLKNNQLTNEIPRELGELNSLEFLYLSNNLLSGEIPETFGMLESLVVMDLGTNELTGPIPDELGQLVNLANLYLRNNKLEGIIPSELGQLNNLTIGSFVNNRFTEIPIFNNSSNLFLTVSGNNFDFTDLEKYFTGVGSHTLKSFSFNPQSKVGEEDEITYTESSNIEVSVPSGGNYTNYQWQKKNQSSAWEDITGATDSLLIIPNSALSDAGEYKCVMTNDWVTSLALESNIITVNIEENQGLVPDSVEYQVLVELYNSTGGASWTNNTNWLNGNVINDMANWYGIVLDSEGKDITSISLGNNNLSGSLPSSLGDLKGLTNLYMAYNNLSGPIPSSLGELINLTSLQLFSNSISGSIPTELGQLNNLTVFYLHDNELTGSIPSELGGLNKLNGLYLYDNNLSDSIPSELGQLNQLTHLYLYDNNLSGNIPPGLGQLSNLQYLYLYDNNLSGSIPSEFDQLSNLYSLNLKNNQLTGDIPDGMSQLGNLKYLDIENNSITNLPNFVNKSNMWVFARNNCLEFSNLEQFFTEAGSHVFSHFDYSSQAYSGESDTLILTENSSLELSVNVGGAHTSYQWYKKSSSTSPYTAIEGATGKDYIIDEISMDDAGKYYCVMTNDWVTGVTISSRAITTIADMVPDAEEYQALIELYDSTGGDSWTNNNNWLQGTTLEDMATWYGISVSDYVNDITNINLGNNNLSGSLPSSLGDLKGLTNLYMAYNNLSGPIPSSLGELINLTSLQLFSNSISGSIPTELGQLNNLTVFYLHDNELNGSIPSELGGLNKLNGLYLHDNNLSDSIPSELGQLNQLTHLYLYDNNLSGSIPSGLGQLTNLQYLYLYNNNLNGSIPSEFDQLSNLHQLNLKNNQLTGGIPDGMSQLGNLKFLYIENNSITNLPDFVNKSNMYVYARNSSLEFGNLEQFFTGVDSHVFSYFDYSNQTYSGEKDTLIFTENSRMELSVSVGGAHTSYQWYKKSSSTSPYMAIEGATSKDYIIDETSMDDAGNYYCVMSNDWVTGLTITSSVITVNVIEKLLVGSWSFNDGNANDKSGNNNHGTVYGGTALTTDRFGNENSAYQFDGTDDYIEIIDNSILEGMDELSISLWVKPMNDLISGNQAFITKGNGWNVMYLDDGLRFHTVCSNENGDLRNPVSLLANNWSHLVLVYNGNQVEGFLNGNSFGKDMASGSIKTDGEYGIIIGAKYDKIEQFFNGSIDDVNIYNYALSESEITELYNVEDPKQLVGSWTFNDATANDESGCENHGTLISSPTIITDRFGNENSAYSFNGTDQYIDIRQANAYDFEEGQDFSISFWMNPEETQPSNYSGIIANGAGSDSHAGWAFHYHSTNGMAFVLGNGVDTRKYTYTYTTPTANEWLNVSITVDRDDSVRLYFNGEFINSGDVSAINADLTNERYTQIGTYYSHYFNGLIDDVNIYNYILSETEIQELYSTPNPKQLIGSWTFIDGTANDESGNNNHGTVNGAILTTDRFGNENSAYNFDGTDDYIEIIDNPILEGMDELSISLWVKPMNDLISGNQAFITKGNGWNVMYLEGGLRFHTVCSNENGDLRNPASLLANNWCHLVLVYNGNQVEGFLNGNSFGKDVASGSIKTDGEYGIIIGAKYDKIEQFFNGSIDDVNIYNYALSKSEITELYNAENPKQLIGSWSFNHGTANDESGNNNHGVVNGATLATDRFGNENSAYSFDGINDYIMLGDNTFDFEKDQDFSVSVWFKIKGDQTEFPGIVTNGVGGSNVPGWAIIYKNHLNNIGYHIGDGVQRLSGNCGACMMNDSNWHHVVLTVDRDRNALFYFDNILIDEMTVDVSIANSDMSNVLETYIGRYYSYYFKGNIDDIQIYNYALSETEIQELYNAEDPKQLIGSWTFNDGTANDESGNNNHGTVNGATLATDRFGNENSAYSFDGIDDYIQFTNKIDVSGQSWSASAWVKYLPNIDHQAVLSGYAFQIQHNTWKLGSYDGTGYKTSTNTINSDEWTMITMVIDQESEKVSYYINGQFDSQLDYDNNFTNAWRITGLGNYDVDPRYTYMFKGSIDDVNIYNYTLSNTEIQELYSTPDPKQLVGSWSFNNGTANDESGNNNHGTVNGATLTTDRFGNENSAYSFDGVDDYISINDNIVFSYGNGTKDKSFSVSASINMEDILKFRILSKSTQEYIFTTDDIGRLSFIMYDVSAGAYIGKKSDVLNDKINTWIDVAAVYDGSGSTEGIKLYIEDVEVTSTAVSSGTYVAMENTDYNIEIGRITDYAKGQIDDVKMYNYALSEAEIQELYNAEDPKQLVGSWTFNDGTANDESGNNNHGTANGAILTQDRFGNGNSAYSFDGVDDTININVQNNFASEKGTVSYWIKTDSSGVGTGQTLFKFYSDLPDEHYNKDFIRSYINIYGKIDLLIEDEDQELVHVQYDLRTLPEGYLDKWLHIVWVQDGAGVKLYIDGNEMLLNHHTEPTSSSWSGHLDITKAFLGNGWEGFKGNIDDFQIYNYALSETEIQGLYNATDPVIKLEVKVKGNTLAAKPEGGDGNYTYQWSTGETTSSITTNEKGIYSVRVEDSKGLSSTATYDYNVTENHFDHNFVKTETARVSGVTKFTIKYLDEEEKSTTFTYFDGLGRQIQTVAKKASPIKNDIVQHIEYDEFGRQVKEYLPYSVSSENGVFREEAYLELKSYHLVYPDIANDVYPYAEKVFDDSPLNRVLEQGAVGTAWQIEKDVNGESTRNGHTVRMNYLTNSPSEVIKWSVDNSGNCTNDGFYAENTLFKNETKDENDHSVIEFVDLNGNTILKKTNDGTVDLFTYYIYDHFECLRYVLPPKAVDQVGTTLTPTSLSELIYYYEYDDEGRLVKKKIPGADEIVMVYDNRDRLVLVQDGNLEDNDKWSFTKYDMLNRPVMTGIVQLTGISYNQLVTAFKNHNIHFESINTSETHKYTLNNSYPSEAAISESDLLTVTYYDNYDCLNSYGYNYSLPSGFATVIRENEPVNQVTGTLIWNLDQSEYYVTVNYYDEYNRVIQTISENHLNGLDKLTTQYDFVGNITQTKLSHTVDASIDPGEKNIWEFYEYDHAGRLIHHYHQYGNSSADKVLMATYEHNENGEQITKKMHSEDGGSNYLQEVNYKYNIRGWLTKINDADLSNSEDLFGMELVYNNPVSNIDPSIEENYNGNITGMYWNTNGTFKKKRGYGFKYDDINRLTDAYYGDNSGWTNGLYDVQGITYDLNGNIRSISRNAGTEHGEIDKLDYVYNGNKLLAVGDVAIGNANLGFNDGVSGSTGTEYLYDDNGNMIDDANKGLNFNYNELNLVSSVSKSTQHFDISYDALGNKLSTCLTITPIKDTRHYIGAFNYLHHIRSGGTTTESFGLEYILTPEGRITLGDAGEVNYEYFLKDHLGNNRVVFADYDDDGIAEIIQEDSYFPYGMQMAGLSERASGIKPNQYLYNGKELHQETGLNWYDYGARMYDAELGRWHVIDPKAEKYYSVTPFRYGLNNPINFIDLKGETEKWWALLRNWTIKSLNVDHLFAYNNEYPYHLYSDFRTAFYACAYDNAFSWGYNNNPEWTSNGSKKDNTYYPAPYKLDLNLEAMPKSIDLKPKELGTLSYSKELKISGSYIFGGSIAYGQAHDDNGFIQNYVSIGGQFSSNIGFGASLNRSEFIVNKYKNVSLYDIRKGSYSIFGSYLHTGYSMGGDFEYSDGTATIFNNYLFYSYGIEGNYGTGTFFNVGTNYEYTFLIGEPFYYISNDDYYINYYGY